MSQKGLGYWKGAEQRMITLREAAKRTFQMYARAVEMAKREVAAREAKILVVIVLAFFVGGCNTLHGAFKDASWLTAQGARNTEVTEGE